MKRIILLLVISLSLVAKVQYHTAQEKKGQKYYLDNCSACHGQGNRGGNLADMDTWKEYFSDSAKELKELHSDDKVSLEYLNSEKFIKQQKKMLKFLLEFASDSDFIPSCNN